MNLQLPKIAGIYAIECKPNGKIYIGQAVHIRGRWSEHASELRAGIHGNSHLQRAWNKYGGEAAFNFSVRVSLATDEMTTREITDSLTALEQMLLNREVRLRGRRNVFNGNVQCVASPLGSKWTKERHAKHRVWLAENVSKISAAQKKRWQDPAHAARMKAYSRANNANEGLLRQKAAANWPEGVVNILWEHAETQRRLLAWNVTATAREIGVNRSAISQLLNGKGRAKKAKGWTVRYVYAHEALEGAV